MLHGTEQAFLLQREVEHMETKNLWSDAELCSINTTLRAERMSCLLLKNGSIVHTSRATGKTKYFPPNARLHKLSLFFNHLHVLALVLSFAEQKLRSALIEIQTPIN